MRVFWAFEPSHHESKMTKAIYQLLKQLAKSPTNIEVGYVVQKHEPLFPMFRGKNVPHYADTHKDQTALALKQSRIPIAGSKVHILSKNTLSVTAVVDACLGLAKSKKADVVALYTHGRSGFFRQVLGSFAETAIHRSPIDLLLLSPKSKPPAKIKRVSFAYDFETTSRKHFLNALNISKRLGATLVVIHAAELTYRWSLDEKNPEIAQYRRRIDKMKSKIEAEAKQKGVRVEVVIKAELAESSQVILKEAEKNKTDLMIVAANAGPLVSLMGGSTTRAIVRTSKSPVLILK